MPVKSRHRSYPVWSSALVLGGDPVFPFFAAALLILRTVAADVPRYLPILTLLIEASYRKKNGAA